MARAQGTSGGSCALDVAHSCPSLLLPAPAWPSLLACARPVAETPCDDMDAGRPATRPAPPDWLPRLALTNRGYSILSVRPSISHHCGSERSSCLSVRPCIGPGYPLLLTLVLETCRARHGLLRRLSGTYCCMHASCIHTTLPALTQAKAPLRSRDQSESE